MLKKLQNLNRQKYNFSNDGKVHLYPKKHHNVEQIFRIKHIFRIILSNKYIFIIFLKKPL